MSGFNLRGTDPDPNKSNFQRADVDPSLTRDGDPDESVVSTAELPAESGSTTLGNVREFYAIDGKEEIENTESHPTAETPAHSPNSWEIEDDADGFPRSRDYYRNDGMIGQDFFDNKA